MIHKFRANTIKSLTVYLLAIFLVALGLNACAVKPAEVLPTEQPAVLIEATPLPSPTPAFQPLTLDVLKNAQYHSPDWGDFQLVDGVYHRTPPTANESPDTYLTQLDDRIALGDLNADGQEDAAVFLWTQNGGTGHFVELAAVLNQAGAAQNISTAYLGDRIGVESAQIAGGVITLDLIVHGPDDPLMSGSQPETWRFQVQNGQLIRLP